MTKLLKVLIIFQVLQDFKTFKETLLKEFSRNIFVQNKKTIQIKLFEISLFFFFLELHKEGKCSFQLIFNHISTRNNLRLKAG